MQSIFIYAIFICGKDCYMIHQIIFSSVLYEGRGGGDRPRSRNRFVRGIIRHRIFLQMQERPS